MTPTYQDLLAAGYSADIENGVVFGKRGRAITKGRPSYIQITNRGKHLGQAHRFIWECANQRSIPAGMEINHINGVKTDNRICNLELVTPSDNSLHAYRTGLSSANGESNGRAILTAEQARQIRESRDPQRVAASRYGVSRRTVRDIRAGTTWSNAA